jgi:hypothetical protein
MAKILVALLATLAFAASTLEVAAQTKKCAEGKVYDPDTGKCVTPRGSH